MVNLNLGNQVCAYPTWITWAIGAMILDTLIGASLLVQNALDGSYFDFLTLFIPSTLLGYFLGMFTFWSFVRKLCSKVNGGPLKVGDRVQILRGRFKGKICDVYDTPKGQGGWDLARIDLGAEMKNTFQDIFEQYALLKLT